MCLTIPKQIVSIAENKIRLKAGKKLFSAASIIPVKKGDWVLTQNDIIIKKITANQAKKINNLLKWTKRDYF